MKKILILFTALFALMFAGCKGADEAESESLQDALLELCEDSTAKDYVNLLFDDSLKTDEHITVEFKDDILTIKMNNAKPCKIFLEDSKVRVEHGTYNLFIKNIRFVENSAGNILQLNSNNYALAVFFDNKSLSRFGFGPAYLN